MLKYLYIIYTNITYYIRFSSKLNTFQASLVLHISPSSLSLCTTHPSFFMVTYNFLCMTVVSLDLLVGVNAKLDLFNF